MYYQLIEALPCVQKSRSLKVSRDTVCFSCAEPNVKCGIPLSSLTDATVIINENVQLYQCQSLFS